MFLGYEGSARKVQTWTRPGFRSTALAPGNSDLAAAVGKNPIRLRNGGNLAEKDDTSRFYHAILDMAIPASPPATVDELQACFCHHHHLLFFITGDWYYCRTGHGAHHRQQPQPQPAKPVAAAARLQGSWAPLSAPCGGRGSWSVRGCLGAWKTLMQFAVRRCRQRCPTKYW